jgi:hypothetical protein
MQVEETIIILVGQNEWSQDHDKLDQALNVLLMKAGVDLPMESNRMVISFLIFPHSPY